MNKKVAGVRGTLSRILVFGGAVAAIFCVAGLSGTAGALDIGVTTPANPVLEVSLSASLVQLDLTPSMNTADFNTANLTVTAATNNLTGYALYMEVANPDLTRTEALADHSTPVIASLAASAEGFSESNFTANRWGYKLSGNNFFAIPEDSLELSSSAGPTNGVDTTLTFGSKVDMSQPAGSYSTDITLRAVTNAPMPILQDIDTWKGSLVANRAVKAQDSRDGKYYNISKLDDNRIWLLDNLALDLTDSGVQANLSAATTNASATSIDALINGGRAGGNQYATSGVSTEWVEDSYSDPLINMESENIIPANAPTNSQGNNRVGGYYNFCATSAGSYCYGDGVDPEDPNIVPAADVAAEDICPAGWRLPSGTEQGDYQTLANTIIGPLPIMAYYDDPTLMMTFRNTLAIPFSGMFNYGDIEDGGSYSGFWSSSRYGINYQMYALEIESDGLYSSSGHRTTSPGLSVRCLVKNPDITITFDANGGTGTMANQTLPDYGGTLNSNAFTRTNYNFIGWNTAADGSGTPYADGDTYTGASTTLYAQWEYYPYMQNITTATCPTTATVAYDSRDEKPYHIQKLADGKCWMLDNLALDLTNALVLYKVTDANTNASATSLNYLKHGGGSTSDQYATAGVANWTSSYSYSAPLVNMASKDVVPDNAPTGGAGYNKVGGYYNFCAASAGSYCYGDGTSYGTSSGNATEDICPAGWRMPTSHGGEYGALANAIYGSTGSTSDATQAANFRNALSLPFPGYFIDGSTRNQGSHGNFWSSTRYDDHYMYSLYASTSYVRPADSISRSFGHFVRCLAGV